LALDWSNAILKVRFAERTRRFEPAIGCRFARRQIRTPLRIA